MKGDQNSEKGKGSFIATAAGRDAFMETARQSVKEATDLANDKNLPRAYEVQYGPEKSEFKETEELEFFFRNRHRPFNIVFRGEYADGTILKMTIEFKDIDQFVTIVQEHMDDYPEETKSIYSSKGTMYAYELCADDLWHVFCSFYDEYFEMHLYR